MFPANRISSGKSVFKVTFHKNMSQQVLDDSGAHLLSFKFTCAWVTELEDLLNFRQIINCFIIGRHYKRSPVN